MKGLERQRIILETLGTRSSIEVKELLEMIPASPATIRRDLTELESLGKIRKARGRISPASECHLPAFELRNAMHDEEKRQIGRAAVKLVNEGDTIILDSGTTLQAMAENLGCFQRLTVITNSISIAYILNSTPVNVFLTGGFLDDMSLVGEDAVQFIEKHPVEKAFISASSTRGTVGLTVISPLQLPIKRQMVASAKEVYALLDESKFYSMGVSLFADFKDLSGIITSKSIDDPELLQRLEEENVQVICTEDPEK